MKYEFCWSYPSFTQLYFNFHYILVCRLYTQFVSCYKVSSFSLQCFRIQMAQQDKKVIMPSSMGAQITELLASTAEISNLMSVLSVLAALLVMLVFLIKLIYQVLPDKFSYKPTQRGKISSQGIQGHFSVFENSFIMVSVA